MAESNTPPAPLVSWPRQIALRVPIAASATALLVAASLPMIEIKGFDTFALDSIALWAARGARVALWVALGCLMFRAQSLSRWWMALAIGILFSPMIDMAANALDLAEMMRDQISGSPMEMIQLKSGAYLCVVGLGFWLLDLLIAGVRRLRSRA